MKEIVIISGKGGTGKTSLTSCFATLFSQSFETIVVDCDVDAADLHLILDSKVLEATKFYSGSTAEINQQKCIRCGKCLKLCKFKAIDETETHHYTISSLSCQGCGVCEYFCPVNAISLKNKHCGDWYIAKAKTGKFIHSQLKSGADNSGKLVSLLRSKAKELGDESDAELILIDGPPGIACPVIASITNCHAVVIVTEPSLSGISDLKRVCQLSNHFEIPAYICVNKWDINPVLTEMIEKKACELNYEYLGKIDYNELFVSAQLEGKNFIEFNDSNISSQIYNVWEKLSHKVMYPIKNSKGEKNDCSNTSI